MRKGAFPLARIEKMALRINEAPMPTKETSSKDAKDILPTEHLVDYSIK